MCDRCTAAALAVLCSACTYSEPPFVVKISHGNMQLHIVLLKIWRKRLHQYLQDSLTSGARRSARPNLAVHAERVADVRALELL